MDLGEGGRRDRLRLEDLPDDLGILSQLLPDDFPDVRIAALRRLQAATRACFFSSRRSRGWENASSLVWEPEGWELPRPPSLGDGQRACFVEGGAVGADSPLPPREKMGISTRISGPGQAPPDRACSGGPR